MKLKTLIKAGSLALSATTILLAQEVKLNIPSSDKPAAAPAEVQAAAPAAAAAAPAEKYSDDVLLETYGWFMMARIGVSELQLTPAQIAAFTRGVALAAAGKEPPHDLSSVGPQMDTFISARMDAALERAKQRNYAAAAQFFSAIKQRPGITSTPSGLCYEIVQPGTGPNAKVTDSVKIKYTGMLLNGQVFDSSEQHGAPLTIALSEAIPGWAEGMQQINKGGKIKLYIPSELAYGDEGAGGIPPASALIFDIEVLDIMPTPAAPATPAAK